MKKQILVIHGGDTHNSYEEYISFLKDFEIDSLDDFKSNGWKGKLQEVLGEEYEIIKPTMPCEFNAKYAEWKLWFEKIIPLLNDEVMLLGHSLGGIFLAKYLAENMFPKKVLATFLIAAPFDDKDSEYGLGDFDLPDNLSKLSEQAGELYIYHSTDDYIVPFIDMEKYKTKLPDAHYEVFQDRGHFTQPEFPEIIETIKGVHEPLK